MAVKKAKTSLVKWDKDLAALAQAATQTEAHVGGGNFIQLANGIMKLRGAEIPGNKLQCVIIDHILDNKFYKNDYDPDNPESPVCYAFGRDDDEMKPHEDSSDPQNEQCNGCEQNEFGTAARGKGKACKNGRRLAMIAASDLDENIAKAELAFMEIPVTSVKGWAGYVRQINDVLKRPPLAVITEIAVIPDAKNQFKVVFNMVAAIEDGDQIGALIERHKSVQKEIAFPYVQIEAAAPAPNRRAGAGGRKVVPARNAAAAAAGRQRKF